MTKHQLAAATLAIWENDVRRFAPDEHLRWQMLLQQLPDDVTAEQLRAALGPITAKNDKEQALFELIFKRALEETKALGAYPGPGKRPRPTIPFRKKWPFLLLLAVLAGLAAWLLWIFILNRNKNLDPGRVEFSIVAGAARTVCPDSVYLKKTGTVYSLKFNGLKNNLQFIRGHNEAGKSPVFEASGSDSLRTAFGAWAVAERVGCVRFFAKDTTGRDSVRVLISAENGQGTLDFIVNIQQLVAGSGGSTGIIYLFDTDTLPYDHDRLIRNLAFESADLFIDFLVRWADWLKVILMFVLSGALWAVMDWRDRKRQNYVAERSKSVKPPYVWNINIRNLDLPDPGEAFSLTVNSLRRRMGDETRLLDLPETVRSTIRRGGMAEFRFRQQTRPPEYLMLVDRQGHRDHRARLHDDLFRILRQNEVLVERFFFDGDISLCYNETYPDGLNVDELLFRFPAHRLLIVSTGRRMFSASSGRLAKWTEQFARWKDRALLSPLPAGEWGRRERALAGLFRFAPASLPGIRLLLEAFDTEEGEIRMSNFDKLAALAPGDPVLLGEGDLLQTLEQHFPDDRTRTWLAACALWPELYYDLTLWLGQWLGRETGEPVATMARLNDLLRLPWLESGEMPDPVRAVLIDWLRRDKPGLENHLRSALHALLAENAPPEDSAAWDDFSMRVAFNEWLFTTSAERKKELEDYIARWIDKNGNPDFITMRELQGKPGPLDNLVPESWKKRLYKGGMRGLGLRKGWTGLFYWMPPFFVVPYILLLWNPGVPVCPGEQADIRLDRDTIHCCASSDVEKSILYEYLMRNAIDRRDADAVDSIDGPQYLRTRALNAESAANVAAACFNAGVPAYRIADSLRQTVPGYRLDTSSYIKEACYWFDRAARADTTLARVQQAAAWCGSAESRPRLPDQIKALEPSPPVRSGPDTLKIDLPDLVLVTGGTFQMGSNAGRENEKPVHEVTVSDFYICKYEVTQKLWRQVMGYNPSSFKGCDDCPVENVSWDDVQLFLQKLNASLPKNQSPFRLPTEAEWEYAARGGNRSKGTDYSGSGDIDEIAWYGGNSGGKTRPVGGKKGNELGLHDMTGNVWEWCWDWYDEDYYKNSPEKNPAGPDSGFSRVLRGGSCRNDAGYCRVAARLSSGPDNRDNFGVGFRPARTVKR